MNANNQIQMLAGARAPAEEPVDLRFSRGQVVVALVVLGVSILLSRAVDYDVIVAGPMVTAIWVLAAMLVFGFPPQRR